MRLTIQEVATKQLESAIWMYAHDFDEVAVHIVACTAYELLLFRLKQGVFLEGLSKEQKRLLKDKHFQENNFFKHGQLRYVNVNEMEFDPQTTEDILMFACEANVRGPEEFRLQCAYLFLLHYSFRRQNLIAPGAIEEMEKRLTAVRVLGSIEDKKTLAKMLNLIKYWRLPAEVKL